MNADTARPSLNLLSEIRITLHMIRVSGMRPTREKVLAVKKLEELMRQLERKPSL